MPLTQSGDFSFEPKVWKDHVRAYFDKKLVLGAIADTDSTLTSQPGTTINFPYFGAIGAAVNLTEGTAVAIDKLTDNSFSATVKEVGKGVGASSKAFKVSATSTDRIIMEITSQMGRVHAEKVDADLFTEFSTAGNFRAVTAATNLDTTVRALSELKVKGFGDKHTDAMSLQINPLDLLGIMTETTAGFLQADALDPFFRVPGYAGTLLGMAVFEVDVIPKGTVYMHKMNPYGLIVKQEMELDRDYDIKLRQWEFVSNEWYAVKSYHAKIHTLDYKTVQGKFKASPAPADA